MSSSMSGTSRRASIFTSSRLASSGIRAPSGFEKLVTSRHALTRMALQGLVEQREVDAGAGVGGHLEGTHAQALDELQGAVIRGRLDDDRVAGAGDGAQAEVQRLHGADGRHKLVRAEGRRRSRPRGERSGGAAPAGRAAGRRRCRRPRGCGRPAARRRFSRSVGSSSGLMYPAPSSTVSGSRAAP